MTDSTRIRRELLRRVRIVRLILRDAVMRRVDDLGRLSGLTDKIVLWNGNVLTIADYEKALAELEARVVEGERALRSAKAHQGDGC